MLDYQHSTGKAPTLHEIQQSVPGLNYRSSARYTIGCLMSKGRVSTAKKTYKHRRYKAHG